jgi:signal transduction histidine kinase
MGVDGGTTSGEGGSATHADPPAPSGRGAVVVVPRRGPWYPLTVAVWLFCILITALLLFSPSVPFGFANRSLHLVLDSVDACIALFVAYLLHNRFLRGWRLQDWLLTEAMLLLAVAGLGLSYVLEELLGIRDGRLNVWLPLIVRVCGAILVLAAALVGARTAPQVLRRWTLAAPALLIAVCSALLWAVRDALPVALDQPPDDAVTPIITGHPVLVVIQAGGAVCFLVASVIFARQAARRDDELLRWFAPAFTLAAFARINYLLFPSIYTDWLYTGDLLRTGCYLLLMIGALRELQHYWSDQTRSAVREDRRRLARELHDGLLQELAYIRIETNGIPPGSSKRHIADATERALDEARAAVNALGQVGDESLGFVLHRTARELAERHRVDLEVDLDDSIQVDRDQRHALMRITREAVLNGVRHGGANHVRIRLERGNGERRLTITDDGSGFDWASASESASPTETGGYGLVSMDDRARGLPGELQIRSSPGEGCMVTVTW